MQKCIDKGLVSGRIVATDSTHVKASIASEELVESPNGPGAYWERLDAYEEEGRKELERRDGKELRHRKQRTKSPKYVHKNVIPVQTATADAAYDFSLAHRVLDDMGISFFVRPQARPNYSHVILQPDRFQYDAEHDR